MSHEAWLALAILGVVLFLGNIIVTPVWKLLADRTQSPPVVAYAQRLVTVTDVAFTATGVVLIIVSGQVMAEDYGGVLSGPAWLTIGWSLFIASGVIWAAALIPIEVLQARLARVFRDAATIPDRYWRLSRLELITIERAGDGVPPVIELTNGVLITCTQPASSTGAGRAAA